MKLLKFLLLLLLLIYACDENTNEDNGMDDDDDDEIILGQRPMQAFINQDSIILASTAVNSLDYEFGSSFRFLRNGRVTGIGVQIPDSATYNVTIWEMTNQTIVSTIPISVDSGEVKYISISPITVSENDSIRVTIQSDDWYIFNHSLGGQRPVFPVTLGDIEILDYAYFRGNTTTYPDTFFDYYHAGLTDIVFDPDS